MLRWIERYGPLSVAVVVTGVATAYWSVWAIYLQSRGQEVSDALSPVFDFATFSAGSLFAIYFLALSRSDGFLVRIFETETFCQFHSYVTKSIALNVALSLWTAAMLIVGPPANSYGAVLLMAAWTGLTAWALLTTARVVLIFLMMVRVKGGRPLEAA